MSEKDCKSIYFFDLDDTLVRTTEFNKAAVKHSLKVLEKFKVNISQSDAWNFYELVYEDINASSNMMELYFGKLFTKYPEYVTGELLPWRVSGVGVCMYQEFFEEHIKEYIPKGVLDSLEKLCEKGYKIGIISQGIPYFQKNIFKNLGLEKYFNPNLRYYIDKKTKKNYKFIVKNMNEDYPNYKLFMVGDREDIDILRSKELGFTPIRIVGTGKYKQNKNFYDYKEYDNFEDFSAAIKSE
jgi:FMN phosphatase YigB (HAD superfamily)